jgi:hypothetical protein
VHPDDSEERFLGVNGLHACVFVCLAPLDTLERQELADLRVEDKKKLMQMGIKD